MASQSMANLNSLWGSLLIEELIRNGGDYFCLAPGSRSSPLAVAVGLNRKAKSFVHYDERGLGFHALGFVAATNRPVVLISTSGTAAANFLPAIIEASKKKLPLIILTSDRPPELRKTGADQTIDQVGLYGDYVRWQFDMPCPDGHIKPAFVLTTVDQAVFRALGSPPGPVHLNCMFREPLVVASLRGVPVGLAMTNWKKSNAPFTQYISSSTTLDHEKIKNLAATINSIKNGIIVVGKLNHDKEREAVCRFSRKLCWPVFPDITSGLRSSTQADNIIHYYDQLLLSEKIIARLNCDGVIHFGGRITSKRWYQFTERQTPRDYIMVLNHPLRNDPLHNVTMRVEAKAAEFCQTILPAINERQDSNRIFLWQNLSKKVHAVLESSTNTKRNLNEPMVARLISKHIPQDSGLFLASSMPIREMDMFASKDGNSVVVGSNRGASGIDGTIASAAGFALGLNKPVTLLIGDLAALHDLNSLAMLKNLVKPLVMVILNNNGGGIFSFLPIARFDKVFEKYFGTPHDLDFNHAAQMFDLNYFAPKSADAFKKIYRSAFARKNSTVIEIKSDRKRNLTVHQELQKKIIKTIAPSFNPPHRGGNH